MQTISMLIYYPAEHISFLGDLGAISMKPETSAHFSRLSCRAWFVYIILDIARDLGQLITIRKQLDDDQNFVKLEFLNELKNRQYALLLKFLINAADSILALSWSLPRASLSDSQVGFIGSISSVCGLLLQWRAHSQ